MVLSCYIKKNFRSSKPAPWEGWDLFSEGSFKTERAETGVICRLDVEDGIQWIVCHKGVGSMRVPRETEQNEDQQNWALTEGECWELGQLMAVWEMGASRERVIKSDRMSRGESGPLTMVWRGSSYYCCTLRPPKTEWLKTTIILLFPTVCVCQAFGGTWSEVLAQGQMMAGAGRV